jgi:nucleotide-binding universal stress UspA family protein
MQSSIICGVDGSPDSYAALAVAAELAERLGTRLVLVNVIDPVPAYAVAGPVVAMSRPAPLAVIDGLNEAGERLVAGMAETAGLEDAEQRVVTGVAAERLADLADEQAADLIVVGSRGRGGFKAALLGSVSSELIGVARCPVLVVPKGVRES